MVCKATVRSRTITAGELREGFRFVLSRPGPCECGSPCRRVALWADRPFNASPAPATLILLHGNISFGDECDSLNVEVDWKTGVMLDLIGCYVEVALEVISSIVSAGAESEQFVVKAMIACCGAGAARGTATWSSALIDGGAGVTATVEIPPFAYALDVTTSDGVSVAATWISSGGLPIGPAAAGGSVPEGAVAIQFAVGAGETGQARFFIGV